MRMNLKAQGRRCFQRGQNKLESQTRHVPWVHFTGTDYTMGSIVCCGSKAVIHPGTQTSHLPCPPTFLKSPIQGLTVREVSGEVQSVGRPAAVGTHAHA
eukprot:360216-Pelagomonas_calceolata.AAC.1